MVHPSSTDYMLAPLHSVSFDSRDACCEEDTDARHGGMCGPAGMCEPFVGSRLPVE